MRVSNELTIPIRNPNTYEIIIDSHFEKYYTHFMKFETQAVILTYSKVPIRS
jgi:hypothetical protein